MFRKKSVRWQQPSRRLQPPGQAFQSLTAVPRNVVESRSWCGAQGAAQGPAGGGHGLTRRPGQCRETLFLPLVSPSLPTPPSHRRGLGGAAQQFHGAGVTVLKYCLFTKLILRR